MEEIENIISCPICMEVFKVPRMLPCQHTFCENCLSTYINDRNKRKQKFPDSVFPCPLCREHVTLNKEPHDGTIFPLNLTIVAIADTAERLKRIQLKEEISAGSKFGGKGDEDVLIVVNDNVGERVDIIEDEQADDVDAQSIGNEITYNTFCKTYIFTDYALRYILLPISKCRWHSMQMSSAVVWLLTSLIIYMYVLLFVISYDVQIIFVLMCYPLFIDFVRFCKQILGRNNVRSSGRIMLVHVVIHIISVALTASFLTLTLFCACVMESIRTQASSAQTTDDYLVNEGEETVYYKVLFVFKTAWHIMLASVDNLYMQWSDFKHTLCEFFSVIYLFKMSRSSETDKLTS